MKVIWTTEPAVLWVCFQVCVACRFGPRWKGRASNKGFLSMGLDDYLRVLDGTDRQVRRDQRGAIPRELAPIQERLGMSAEFWGGHGDELWPLVSPGGGPCVAVGR